MSLLLMIMQRIFPRLLLKILGKMLKLMMMLKSFSIANWNLLSVYFIIPLRIPTTPQAFLGWRVCVLSCSSFHVIGESRGFWEALIVILRFVFDHVYVFALYSLL